jgi:hypothetical protein
LRILFRYVLSVALQRPHRRPFTLGRCSNRWGLGRCLPLSPLDFSLSTSPSPIHLLHDLTIFPVRPRVFSYVSCELRLYTVVDLLLLTTDGTTKEEVYKFCLLRTSLNLRILVSSSPPAQSPHSSVPKPLLPAEPRCRSYSLIETLTTCNSAFPSPATRRGPRWPHPPNILLEPRSQGM